MGLVLFAVIGGVTLIGAVGVVATRNVVYAALFLLAALGGVAALFLLLLAEFLALVQVLIYGGAVIIVILFALMLTRSGEFQATGQNRRWPFAAAVSGSLFVVLTVAFIGDADRFDSDTRTGVQLEVLGRELFERWAVPFEIASLVLLVALIGAVVIGRAGAREDAAESSGSPGPGDGRAGVTGADA